MGRQLSIHPPIVILKNVLPCFPSGVPDDRSYSSLNTHYLLAALLGAITPPSNPGEVLLAPFKR